MGIGDRDRIGRLVSGRNTSRQVKSWSLADFDGTFDWIRDVLDRKNGPFAGRIGYEENAGKEVTILDVLSYLTLFHQEFDAKGVKDSDHQIRRTGTHAGHRLRSGRMQTAALARPDGLVEPDQLLGGAKRL